MTKTRPAPFLAVATLAAVGLLTACSDGAPPAPPTAAVVTPSASASPAASPSRAATTKALSEEDWADAMAPLGDDLTEALDTWDENTCSSLALEYSACGSTLTVLAWTVDTIDMQLGGLTDSNHDTFLGTVPEGVFDLTRGTRNAAEHGAELGRVALEACDGDITSCQGEAFEFMREVDALRDAFTAWGRVD